ncbi:MAG: AraC family transcriptional regulator [Pseudonocardiales bacterium]|nr:AraC family transcriptional regulator [Pseudonocardiales bacterium]
MTRVVFVVVPGVHLLDLAGPAQVFSVAADFGLGYALHYVADSETVVTAQGLTIQAALDWPDLDIDDLIVVPGWRSPRLQGTGPLDSAMVERIRDHHARGGTVASVCAGADVLGRAGLLDGRHCTTHHDLQDELSRRYPAAHVVPDVLYTVEDGVVTSAGIASGIDLALHLVATSHGAAAAAQVARQMVIFVRRNGDEPQASAMLRHRAHLDDPVHRAQDVIDRHFTTTLRLSQLAVAANVSERTLTRMFTHAIGMTPLRYQQTLRLERAEHLLGHGDTLESAARAVGFEDARMLRRLRARDV